MVYPNPLVADLMTAGIVNRIAFLHDRQIESGAEILTAMARLEAELDQFAIAVRTSIEFLEGRSLGSALGPSQHIEVCPPR